MNINAFKLKKSIKNQAYFTECLEENRDKKASKNRHILGGDFSILKNHAYGKI